VEHYFTSAEQDTDGSIYIGGVVFEEHPPNPAAPRASILLRLDSMGCFDASCNPMDVVEIEALQNSDIIISPNPARDRVQIDLRDENFAGGFLQIYTANGQKLSRVALHSQHHAIDITSWPSGIYYVSYEHKKYFYKGKLVVR
jgi:Secretion system C-terminal sorting domain